MTSVHDVGYNVKKIIQRAAQKADAELSASEIKLAGPPIHKIYGDEAPGNFDARYDENPSWKIWTSVKAEWFQKHSVGIIFTTAADIDDFPLIRLYRVFDKKDGSQTRCEAARKTIYSLITKVMRKKRSSSLLINMIFESVGNEFPGQHQFIGSHEGFPWTLINCPEIVRRNPLSVNTECRENKYIGFSVRLDFGLVEQGSCNISWNENVNLTIGLDRKEPQGLRLKHSPLGYFVSMDDDQNICLRWNGINLISGERCRWYKLQYFSKSDRREVWGHIVDRMTFGRHIQRNNDDSI